MHSLHHSNHNTRTNNTNQADKITKLDIYQIIINYLLNKNYGLKLSTWNDLKQKKTQWKSSLKKKNIY